VGKFNSADDKADLLCNDTVTGDMTIDWSASSYFGSVNWSYPARNFCRSSCEQMRVGDFDGDDRTDILCNNTCNGALWVDLNTSGVFSGSELHQSGRSFCTSAQKLLIADLSGDARDDIACWDPTTGVVKIDVGDEAGIFDDPSPNGDLMPKVQGSMGNFCAGSGKTLYLGQFGRDARADFMCHRSDLEVAYSDLTLPLLFDQVSLAPGGRVEYGEGSMADAFSVPDGHYLLAYLTGPDNDSNQNADLRIITWGGGIHCEIPRDNSFEQCTARPDFPYSISVTNQSSTLRADVTVQVYSMPGPELPRLPGPNTAAP
jgi:hypothetical protein